MTGIQDKIYYELEKLLSAVEEGKYGEGDAFDRDAFEAEFDDEVLIVTYVCDRKDEK